MPCHNMSQLPRKLALNRSHRALEDTCTGGKRGIDDCGDRSTKGGRSHGQKERSSEASLQVVSLPQDKSRTTTQTLYARTTCCRASGMQPACVVHQRHRHHVCACSMFVHRDPRGTKQPTISSCILLFRHGGASWARGSIVLPSAAMVEFTDWLFLSNIWRERHGQQLNCDEPRWVLATPSHRDDVIQTSRSTRCPDALWSEK